MKQQLIIAILFLPMLALSQITIGQVDDFEDSTIRFWHTNSTSVITHNIPDGGPLGVGDNFLRFNSTLVNQLQTTNTQQWAGNYISQGVTYISMDVRNPSGSPHVIFLRLVFSNQQEAWSTITAITVLPGEGWKKVTFAIDEASMIRVSGSNSYVNTFSNISQMSILHSQYPAQYSNYIISTLDVDNITAINQASLSLDETKTMNDVVKVVPNPAKNYFQLKGLKKRATMKIFSLTGALVKNNISLNSEDQINIQDLEKGTYIIQMETENKEVYSCKFIKN
ncbi:MAG: hypothetical protein K0R36_1911 [Chryseobacterium sp.]|jgi:hypothetical protein|nr:hypothetical protein [Chryseobacterium sp.]